MIILEGPDGAGKTQLARRLSTDLNIEIEPRVVQSDMTSDIPLAEWAYAQMQEWPRKIIYDRFTTISEFIYGPLYRGDVRPGFDLKSTFTMLTRMFEEANPVVVYCMPPLNNVITNVTDDALNIEAAPKIKGLYWLYFDRMVRDPNCLVWDYTMDKDSKHYAELLKSIKWKNWERNKLVY